MNQTAQDTEAAMNHHPPASPTLRLLAAESEPPDAVVPLGRVPLMSRVLVPFTSATRATVEFISLVLPLPTTESR